jgi:hypothetical protein
MASSGTGISKTGTVLAALAAVVIAAGVGYGLHKAAKKRSEARAVVSVVSETTTELRGALKTPSREALEKIEGNLRVAKTWSNAEVADATEIYLLGAREIMRRRVEATRDEEKAAASRAALSAHMTRAGQRDTPWIRTALDLKKQVERDHVDLDIQLKALADLLDTLPDAHKRLAPHVQDSLLLEDDVRRRARNAVLEEAKHASAELDKARSLLLPH